MSFQTKLARSSRTTNSRRSSAAASLKRSTSSPSNASPRKRSLPSESTLEDDDEPLDDTGIIVSLAEDLNFRDVPQYMEYIHHRMFSEMPEKAGMNSTRIAEVLNFRKRLPPFVTIAHVDALCNSSTTIEREIAELAKAGILRRVTIPHRGTGAAAVGDGIASVRDWQAIVRQHQELQNELKEKYIAKMAETPTSASITGAAFTPTELSALIATGFLTSSTASNPQASYFASPGANALTSISSSGSRHAAGSLGAVGGVAATQHIHGGTSLNSSRAMIGSYNFSLPNTGTHIKLLVDARNHLISIVKKTKYKEMPLDVLRERWDGGIAVHGAREERKKARGEFAGVLPGRTKKWKQFYGMRFEWVLEECLGAGLLELFETGSVGKAVRAST
ncbi:serine-threonine protein kinase 19-domain-containing protein [Phaeosphaeria sp. MPI-PUGE-AT-0046c]|nr:serine-threonine protein kinase 19-domain-containing protein [Phaeosphaeria sp. MPI-PUGE-AT-0046c]